MTEPAQATVQKVQKQPTVIESAIAEANDKGARHNRPLHVKNIPSLLTSSSEEHNFRGFFNLALIIVVVSHFRIVIENFLKYGLLLNSTTLKAYILSESFLYGLICLNLPVFFALFLEKQASTAKDNDTIFNVLHVINALGTVAVPSTAVYFGNFGFIGGLIFLSMTYMLFMKLLSFAAVCRDTRQVYWKGGSTVEDIKDLGGRKPISYPDNLTIGQMYYFLAVPVLVYQMNYPRTTKIRWYWLLGKVAQLIFLLMFGIFMVEQFIIPTIKNTLVYMEPSLSNFPFLIARLLKLAIPSLVLWLAGFYAFFHLGLNIFAEVLQFGDREFYHDWWNATTLAEYWRKWNLPVHNWLVRHIYFPLRRRNIPRPACSIAIFFISALFHEFLSSVPLGFVRFYFFFGMLFQSPLAILTEIYTKGSQFGNIVFWSTFCIIGQPMILMLYYYDWWLATTMNQS